MCEKLLYYGDENESLDNCSVCNEPRYKEDTLKHLTARKVFRYFPIEYRLRQLFNHRVYSHLFLYGDRNYEAKPDDYMDDIHHAPIWQKLHDDLPLFNSDKSVGVCDRHVGFILSADGASMSTCI